MTLLGVLLGLFTPPFFPVDTPKNIKIIVDTPELKFGVEGTQFNPQKLYKFKPNSDQIIKTIHVPRGGGGDGGGSFINSPNGSAFILTAYSVGMSLEITKSTVLDHNFRPLPIDIDFCYGIDNTSILGAPDINRYPGQRMSSSGPLSLFQISNAKLMWRRYDISSEHSFYNAQLTPNTVIVRFPHFKNAVKVLDRSTGKTLFSDPPEQLTIGKSTFNPWFNLNFESSDITHFSNGLIEPRIKKSTNEVLVWSTPKHTISAINYFNNETAQLIFNNPKSGEKSSRITLPKWVVPYNLQCVNSPDSDLYALNCFGQYGWPPTPCFSIIVKNGMPIITNSNGPVVKLTPSTIIHELTYKTSTFLVSTNLTTKKRNWKSKALGNSGVNFFTKDLAIISKAFKDQPRKIVALNLLTGKEIWEILQPPQLARMTPKNEVLLLQSQKEPTQPDTVQVINIKTGKKIGEYNLLPQLPPEFNP